MTPSFGFYRDEAIRRLGYTEQEADEYARRQLGKDWSRDRAKRDGQLELGDQDPQDQRGRWAQDRDGIGF